MIEYTLEITINDETIKICGINKAHYKSNENAIKAVKKEIDRTLKSYIQNGSIYEQD